MIKTSLILGRRRVAEKQEPPADPCFNDTHDRIDSYESSSRIAATRYTGSLRIHLQHERNRPEERVGSSLGTFGMRSWVGVSCRMATLSKMNVKQMSANQLAEWIELERKCCPFFGFEIQWASENGPVWLHLSAPEGVKEFILD